MRTIGPFGIATVIASAGFMAAGIFQPQAAEVLVRLLVASLALGFILSRAYEAMLPARISQDFYSPFDGSRADRQDAVMPDPVRKLAAGLAPADDPRRGARTPIPRAVRWRIIDEAARRLADHHGLDIRDPADHAAIRDMVSVPTWELIGAEATSREASPVVDSPLSRVPVILDDLEAL